MQIIDWIKRRTKSRYADDKAVNDFIFVAKDQGLSLDDRGARLKELLTRDFAPTGAELIEIANLLGQVPNEPKA